MKMTSQEKETLIQAIDYMQAQQKELKAAAHWLNSQPIPTSPTSPLIK